MRMAIKEAPTESLKQIEKWEQKFRNFWESKTEEELWDLLFLEGTVEGCTSVLLCHPLENNWIVRNPIQEGKWWETKLNRYGPLLYDSPLPCEGCKGRG